MIMFKSKHIAPSTVPTGKVDPVHYWDDTTTFRSVVLYNLFRVDHALDAQKYK